MLIGDGKMTMQNKKGEQKFFPRRVWEGISHAELQKTRERQEARDAYFSKMLDLAHAEMIKMCEGWDVNLIKGWQYTHNTANCAKIDLDNWGKHTCTIMHKSLKHLEWERKNEEGRERLSEFVKIAKQLARLYTRWEKSFIDPLDAFFIDEKHESGDLIGYRTLKEAIAYCRPTDNKPLELAERMKEKADIMFQQGPRCGSPRISERAKIAPVAALLLWQYTCFVYNPTCKKLQKQVTEMSKFLEECHNVIFWGDNGMGNKMLGACCQVAGAKPFKVAPRDTSKQVWN